MAEKGQGGDVIGLSTAQRGRDLDEGVVDGNGIDHDPGAELPVVVGAGDFQRADAVDRGFAVEKAQRLLALPPHRGSAKPPRGAERSTAAPAPCQPTKNAW